MKINLGNLDFCEYAGIFFCPNYNSFVWSECWIKDIIRFRESAYEYVSGFIDIGVMPKLFVFHKKIATEIKKDVDLKHWVKALTVQSNIFFFNPCVEELENIIRHEMFHVGINNNFPERDANFPKWLNEAIAYYIGNNCETDMKKTYKYIKDNSKIVVSMLLTDRLINKTFFDFDIIKSFGYYFCSKYEKEQIKLFIIESSNTKDMNTSMINILKCSYPKLIKDWFDYVYKIST